MRLLDLRGRCECRNRKTNEGFRVFPRRCFLSMHGQSKKQQLHSQSQRKIAPLVPKKTQENDQEHFAQLLCQTKASKQDQNRPASGHKHHQHKRVQAQQQSRGFVSLNSNLFHNQSHPENTDQADKSHLARIGLPQVEPDENLDPCFPPKQAKTAEFAASQHELDGFYQLGFCFCNGIGCEKDLNVAKENYLIAAELGHIFSAYYIVNMLDESDPVCWLWLGRAALHGFQVSFLDSFSEQVEQFFSGSGNATIVLLIGRALKGNIDMERRLIFGRGNYDVGFLISPANQAVSFYDSQIQSARLAIDTWTLVSIRLHLIKDMRIYIGKMIWESRFEANYAFDLDDDYDLSSASSSSSPAYLSSASSSSESSPILKRPRK